jgi:hypothetical protein
VQNEENNQRFRNCRSWVWCPVIWSKSITKSFNWNIFHETAQPSCLPLNNPSMR